MPTATSWLPRGRPFVVEDLVGAPDDGNRYELIDGVLLVSAAPVPLHQRVVIRLTRLLEDASPEDIEALPAPLDVRLADDTVMEPDIVVAPVADYTDKWLPTAPLLAVEVLSPSTRAIDLTIKQDRLRRAGCPHYWVVDPAVPAVTAWRLVDGTYEVAGQVSGDSVLRVDEPFPVEVVPRRLVER